MWFCDIVVFQYLCAFFYRKSMLKEFLIVGLGSFFGGGARYLVSRLMALLLPSAGFAGTLTVNIVGCFALGLLSAMPWCSSALNQLTRLLLVTGFCGGFTTFSTFMGEGVAMVRDGSPFSMVLYLLGSLAAGAVALVAGNYLAKCFQ